MFKDCNISELISNIFLEQSKYSKLFISITNILLYQSPNDIAKWFKTIAKYPFSNYEIKNYFAEKHAEFQELGGKIGLDISSYSGNLEVLNMHPMSLKSKGENEEIIINFLL